MGLRRSARSKHTVNYAKQENEVESDDDFATPTRVATRKSKTKVVFAPLEVSVKPCSRLPDKEKKRFEADLDLAIKLSRQTTNNNASTSKKSNNAKLQHLQKDDQQNTTRLSASIQDVEDDIVELLDRRSQKRSLDPGYNAVEYNKSDDDYSSGGESNPESDFDERPSRPKRKKQTKSKEKAFSTQTSSEKLTSISAKRTKVISNCSKWEVKTNKSNLQTHLNVLDKNSISPFKHRPWTPPALAGEPPKVKAPVTSSTSLRLGLSRNVRLKPLHASLKTK